MLGIAPDDDVENDKKSVSTGLPVSANQWDLPAENVTSCLASLADCTVKAAHQVLLCCVNGMNAIIERWMLCSAR